MRERQTDRQRATVREAARKNDWSVSMNISMLTYENPVCPILIIFYTFSLIEKFHGSRRNKTCLQPFKNHLDSVLILLLSNKTRLVDVEDRNSSYEWFNMG